MIDAHTEQSKAGVLPTVALDDENSTLVILDQTRLPKQAVLLRLASQQQIHDAICKLQVRGAPAIGVAAAIGLYLAAKQFSALERRDFFESLHRAKEYLASARPTAVNLFWALDRMEQAALSIQDQPIGQIVARLRQEALAIRQQDIECCRRIGEYGLHLLKPGMGLLTHCNAGRLAAVDYGTATAPIYLGTQRGYHFRVFADETRPLLQGARLTAYELQAAGVDVTLLCDNMVSTIMKRGKVDAVLVGCDRVAANGDTANKIGTSGVAILARHYGVPFYVCAPTSTIDIACSSGAGICIEERPAQEVTDMWYEHPMAPEGIAVYNPAFDITDGNLIDAIITEYGILRPPFSASIPTLFETKAELF